MIYYLLLYPIKTIGNGKYAPVILGLGGVVLVPIFFAFFNTGKPFYGGGVFRYFAFFLIMLQGAMMGKNQASYKFRSKYMALLLLSIAMFYIFFYIGKDNGLILLSFVALMGVVRYGYLCCLANPFRWIYEKKSWGQIIFIISQLCLEVYLMQKFIFTKEMNYLFPLNIPIIMFAVIIVAYLTKAIAELISQTFKSEPYEWHKMLLHK